MKYFKNNEYGRDSSAVIKYSAFKLSAQPFSKDIIQALCHIKDCSNYKIYDNLLIRNFIDHNWNSVFRWALFYSITLFLCIFLFVSTIQYGRLNYKSLVPFMTLYCIIFLCEVVQLCRSSKKDYFSNIWNIVDILTPFVLVYWLLSEYFEISSPYEEYFLALLLVTRSLNGFRVFKGTRYYIKLIFTSLSSIKYFIVMFFYSTFIFALIILISKNQKITFYTIWEQSWKLNFSGDLEDGFSDYFVLSYISVFSALIVNVILMLNMLISILGDSYDNFTLEKNIIDYREKLDICLEIQTVIFWKISKSKERFFHILREPVDEDEDNLGEWQGKILYIEKRQERRIDYLHKKTLEIEQKLEKSMLNLESKIQSSSNSIENSVSEMKNSIEKKFENRLDKIENNIQRIVNILDQHKFKEVDNR